MPPGPRKQPGKAQCQEGQEVQAAVPAVGPRVGPEAAASHSENPEASVWLRQRLGIPASSHALQAEVAGPPCLPKRTATGYPGGREDRQAPLAREGHWDTWRLIINRAEASMWSWNLCSLNMAPGHTSWLPSRRVLLRPLWQVQTQPHTLATSGCNRPALRLLLTRSKQLTDARPALEGQAVTLPRSALCSGLREVSTGWTGSRKHPQPAPRARTVPQAAEGRWLAQV